MSQWKKYLFTIIFTMLFTITGMMIAVSAVFGFNLSEMGEVARLIGVMRFIELKYVDTVNSNNLMNGAIKGMIGSLGDPHSVYMDEAMYTNLKSHTEGNFGGVGIVMSFPDGKVKVSSVLDEAPAKAAGILAGDEVLAVDGTPVSEMQADETAMRIRGKEGTEVTLTIHREGEEDKDYTITRSTIPFKTAAGDMVPDHPDMGYIRIASFGENTAKEFKEIYTGLEEKGMKGLIIDLRSDPGGLVTACVDIANMVVPKGEVVYMIDKDGNKESYQSELEESKYPIVVLIDENSASASEILSGALQDREAAIIVGKKSYGKGSVQMVLPMLAGDAMKLTIAKYYIPSGRCIDGIGIEPDVEVDADWSTGVDTQLAKAVEVLQGKIQ